MKRLWVLAGIAGLAAAASAACAAPSNSSQVTGKAPPSASARAKSASAVKAPLKCQDGVRSHSTNGACSTRGGVDKATQAAEAQPGEPVAGGMGHAPAPVTNAVPSGDLKAK